MVFLRLSFKNYFPYNFHFSAFSLKLPLYEVSLCFTSKSFPLLFAPVGRVQDRPMHSLTDSVSKHGRTQCVSRDCSVKYRADASVLRTPQRLKQAEIQERRVSSKGYPPASPFSIEAVLFPCFIQTFYLVWWFEASR